MTTKTVAHVLIVEDRGSLRRLMRHTLEQAGYAVAVAEDGTEGIRRLEQESFDLVLTDMKLPGANGLQVVEASRRLQPAAPVVVLTAYGTVAAAVEAMKLGAADFLEKPVEIDELTALAASLVAGSAAAGSPAARERPGGEPGSGEPGSGPPAGLEIPGGTTIVGRHPSMRAAFRLLKKVAPTESTVLLTGETGTGKELFARALHAFSPRASGPFVAVNCAAIPETLMENELFGHEKGAFTGAGQLRRGRFELAERGTIFLDEIGELDLGVQGKTLRVLEERTFERVGGGRPIRADVRVVAATNRDLGEMAARGEFRQDLLFRLDVFPIELPPLRERPSDVAGLARHMVRRIADRLETPPPELAASALELLAAQDWPGNVRQLANVLERAVILDERGELRAGDLEPYLRPAGRSERDEVREALHQAGGDKRRAAEILGISLRSLQRKVREHDLEGVPRYRD